MIIPRIRYVVASKSLAYSYYVEDIIEKLRGKLYGNLGHCANCDVDVYTIGHYYMVYNYVWKKVPKRYQNFQLCLDCLEHYLDRPLTVCDFQVDCVLNPRVIEAHFDENGVYARNG